jgi:hypothetical protein
MLREFERSGRVAELDAHCCGWLAEQLERLDDLEARLADTPAAGYDVRNFADNPESNVIQPE